MNVALRVAILFSLAAFLTAAEPTAEQREFQAFVRGAAARMRAGDRPPATRAEWLDRKAEIRRRLEDVWNFPETKCPLEPRVLGAEQRDGYRFERLIFQTMPDVWMTAFAYVPETPGKHPAILHVHGHWKGAKQDPVVQARCIGAAKLGFFVLAVDAFGAGERGLTKNLGEYHGEMVGATLFPIGKPLSGIQVFENMRAVDYLQSRPEVDPERIGITGASGGGNQSMYAGCYDERIGCVIPCCSVGTYDSYLTTASCMCEVVPTTLTFTEEWGILSLAAPRGLLVFSATKDAFQFSVGEAKKSLSLADPVFALMGQPAHLRHDVFFWHHDYSRSMREAMYGWMTYHLKGEGDGAPIAEPKFDTYDPESIRCFPNGTRPEDWLTLPQFAAREGRALLAAWPMPATKEDWESKSAALRTRLIGKTFGGFPEKTPLQLKRLPTDESDVTRFQFEPEPGLHLTVRWEHPPNHTGKRIILNLEGAEAARTGDLVQAAKDAQCQVITLDLRATGALAWPHDSIMRAPDHNSAQWSMWIGRPLLGQWTYDVLRLLDALEELDPDDRGRLTVAGEGPAGVVALCAAAVDDRGRIGAVIARKTLASYVSDTPYEGERVGILAPGIVRDVGDIPVLAALALGSERRVTIVNPVSASGKELNPEETAAAYAVTKRIAGLLESVELDVAAGGGPQPGQ